MVDYYHYQSNEKDDETEIENKMKKYHSCDDDVSSCCCVCGHCTWFHTSIMNGFEFWGVPYVLAAYSTIMWIKFKYLDRR